MPALPFGRTQAPLRLGRISWFSLITKCCTQSRARPSSVSENLDGVYRETCRLSNCKESGCNNCSHGRKIGVCILLSNSTRVLLRYVRPYSWRVTTVIFVVLASEGLTLGIGLFIQRLIDSGLESRSENKLNTAALIMCAAVASLAALTCTRFLLISRISDLIGVDLRKTLFSHIIRLSPSYFETARKGDILTCVTSDVTMVQIVVVPTVAMLVRFSIQLVGSFVMLFVISPNLAAIVLAAIPLIVVPLAYLGRRERVLSRFARDRLADVAAYIDETMTAMSTLQAFTHEAVSETQFSSRIDELLVASFRMLKTRALRTLVVILLGFGAVVLSLWIGGRNVLAGHMTTGGLAAFVFYAYMFSTAGEQLSELWGQVKRASGAWDRITELFSEESKITPPKHPTYFTSSTPGHIVFDQVTFCYPSRTESAALNGLSFEVTPGSTLALVGPSGAGKSSIFQLLLRFYDIDSGAIRVDGIDVRQAEPTNLRQQFAIVPQEPVIFGANCWENIRYGRPEATEADIRQAIGVAAAEFLYDLPQGLNTFLGEKGIRLSGGQRQRVAIARAFLRDAPILLLDEATSALDSKSENVVQSALTVLSKNRTTIVVAHRLATVLRADKILVLDNGKIVEQGTHDTLLRNGGLYAQMAALQFVGKQSPDASLSEIAT